MSPRKRSSNVNDAESAKKQRFGADTEDQGYASQQLSFESFNQEYQRESEVGIIERISLTNFMCHSKLDLSFGPNVNFVIGSNGSGKSAVLTGLVVGLGERATVTNRASNMKNFIKTGQNQASVEIFIRNKGPDAFKLNEYGSAICVERKISKDGSSIYKIKSANGKVISNKKDELSAILDHFNIQVHNPVTVLNQTTSRNFIGSKNPKQMYSFFLKATQLFNIKKSNTESYEKLEVARSLLLQKSETLPKIQREVEDWEHRVRLLEGMEELREKVLMLKRELGWSLIISYEKTAEEATEKFQTESQVTEILEQDISNLKDCLQQKSAENADLNNKLHSLVTQVEKHKKEETASKNSMLALKTLVRNKEKERMNAKNNVDTLISDEDDLQKQINEIINSEPPDTRVEKELREKQLSETGDRLRELEETMKTKKVHLENVKNSVAHHSEEYQQRTQEIRNIESRIASVKRNIQDLEGSRRNKFQAFGKDMPLLVEKIDQAYKNRKFTKKPIGPIGACISLADDQQQWAVAIEKCLGRLLQAFCCDNFDDEKVLRQLINTTIQGYQKPSIIVSKYQSKLYDVKQHEVNFPPYNNVLRTLRIDNPVVANCLIDQRNIESIILISNPEEARLAMTRNVPKNCSQTFTKEGDQVLPVPSFRYYSNLDPQKVSRYLKGSVDEKIQEARDQILKLQTDLQNAREVERAAQTNLVINKKEQKAVETEVARVAQERAKVNIEINTIMNFVEPEPVDVTSLEEEIKMCQQKRQQMKEEIVQCQKDIEEARDEHHKLLANYKDITTNITSLMGESEKLREKLEDLSNEISDFKNEVNALERKLRQQKDDVQALKSEAEKAREKFEKNLNKAGLLGERIDNRRLCSAIQAEIMEIQKSLDEEEERQGNEEEITQRYNRLLTQYNKIKEDIRVCNVIIKDLEQGVKKRQERFIDLRGDTAYRVKLLFNSCLSRRKYDGSVSFNHENGTLTLHVQPDANCSDPRSSTRSLSGGERSFSSVCFILALWDTMESPFRILDEYDVFMDMVNRRISMDLMLSTAKTKLHNQFIFLTPLNMIKIPESSVVKILRMPDPERSAQSDEENDQH